MQSKSRRRLVTALLGGSALLPAPLHAQSVRGGVEVSTSAEAVSNPYLDSNSDGFVGGGALEVRPWLRQSTATDSIDLEAFARLRAFTSEFDLEDSYGGSVRASSRLSALTSAYGSLSILSSSARNRISSFGRVPGVTEPINPVDPFPEFPIGDDLSLLGLPGRTTAVNIQAGGNRALNQRESMGANVAYQKVITDNAAGVDYENASAGLSYSNRLSERTGIGFGANVSRVRYDGNFPDSTTLNASTSVDHQAGQYWTLAASAGLATTRSDASSFGPANAALYVIGDASACYRPPDQSFCLTVSRAQQPSALGGVRAQASVGFSLSQRLNARSRIEASANYGHSGSVDASNLAEGALDFVSLRTQLTRNFGRRVDGYVYLSGSRIYDNETLVTGFTDRPSIAFGAGIRVRFGSMR